MTSTERCTHDLKAVFVSVFGGCFSHACDFLTTIHTFLLSSLAWQERNNTSDGDCLIVSPYHDVGQWEGWTGVLQVVILGVRMGIYAKFRDADTNMCFLRLEWSISSPLYCRLGWSGAGIHDIQ